MLRVKSPNKSGKKSLARSLRCTWVVRTLGYASSVTESIGVRAPVLAEVARVMCGGGRSSCPMITKPGAKEARRCED
jgi:hypothetical protein